MKKRIFDLTGIVLILGTWVLCWLFVMQYGVFGSKVDWISQHSVIPDYFRQRFYATGDLFPDIAWNLGGGQNIYNFSYYGLFSPVILLSYLLPFVEMDHYIMFTSILSFSASSFLFYQWLKRNLSDRVLSRAAAVLFTLATPLLYHSYNQLMFVNYMPFLCLALLGVDAYCQKRKKGLLIAGVCGMILTSFYFSIGGMAAIMLYVLTKFERRENWKKTGVKMFQRGTRTAGVLFLCVCICGILLVPTALVLSSRGQSGGGGISSLSWTLMSPLRLLYSPYGVGMSALGIVALLGNIFPGSRRQDRLLSLGLVILFTVPVFGWILNGGLYVKDKVFIPFLPLVVLEIARYIQELKRTAWIKNKRRMAFHILPYLAAAAFICIQRDTAGFRQYWLPALADCALMLLLYLVYLKFNRYPLSVFGACLILFFSGWMVNKNSANMIPAETYEKTVQTDVTKAMKEILEEDTGWYRMEEQAGGAEELADIDRIRDIRQNVTSMYSSAYNEDYMEFRNKTFGLNQHFRNSMMQAVSDNPLFLQLMGVKYVTGQKAPAGYQLLKEGKDGNLYVNESVSPLAYVTSDTMGEEAYRTLHFPENQTALLQKAVVKNADSTAKQGETLESMSACGFSIPEQNTKKGKIEKTDYGWEVEAKEELQLTIPLDSLGENQDLLALSFRLTNKKPNQDVYIRLQGQTNRLTAENHEYANHNRDFSFTVQPDMEKRQVTLILGKGHYEISNLKAYGGNLESLQANSKKLYQNPLEQVSIEDNQLTGKVETYRAGYLITSLPFDKHFRVYVDGKEVQTEKVNTAFLGAQVPKGNHTITIAYRAPGKTAGLLLTGGGGFLLFLDKVKIKRRSRKKKNGMRRNVQKAA